MKVALDAEPLSLSSGGLRRYVSELTRALSVTFPDDEFVLVPGRPPRGASPLDRRWWLFGLNRELARLGAGLFHGTNFEVPYIPRRPAVVTIHDLSPWMESSWHEGARRVRRRTPLLLRFGLATMIITVSRTVRQQVIDRFRVPPERVVPVPLAPAADLHRVETRPEAPYFLYLGTVEPRKNIGLIVDAWRLLRTELDIDLFIAGRRRADGPLIAPEPGLRLLGEVPDERLSALYSGAAACLYPSLYEGFGLPVIEAMQCGTMVIASCDAAITEVAGGAAVQVDARDRNGWIEAMRAAATRPDWAAGWRARASARAKEFSWNNTARLTREVYEEAIRRYPARRAARLS